MSPEARGALVMHGAFHLPDQSWQWRRIHDAEVLFGAAGATHQLCTLFGAPGRVDIACALLRLGPAEVPEIAAACELPASEVERHMVALKEQGLAREITDGSFPVVSIPPERRGAILALLAAAAEMR